MSEVSPEDYNGPTDFVHLHNHTVFSPLDGVASPERYAEECEKRGYPGMSATEHGNMASVPDMYFAFKKRGLKFIPGCELYFNDYEPIRQAFVADGGKITRLKEEDPILHQRMMRNRHITVLAKNETGFHNLIKLATKAYEFGYYYKPRIWLDKLREYKEGLIILSGCLNGPISHELFLDFQSVEETGKRHERVKGRDYTAMQYAKEFKKEFGDDFFIEVQMPCLPEMHDHKIFWTMIQIAENCGTRVLFTNDSHYLSQKDFYLQCVMMAVDQKTTVDDPNLFSSNSEEQYFKTRAELWATFKNNAYSERVSDEKFEELCDNTLLVAERCEILKPDTSPKIPNWSSVEPGVDPAKELRKVVKEELVLRGLHRVKKKYPVDGRKVTYIEQAMIELDRFIDKGFASYFLITRDLIQFGRKHGWPFGPRGSAGGSLVCFLLGIHCIDPLKWGLSFDRFMASSRGGYMLKVKLE